MDPIFGGAKVSARAALITQLVQDRVPPPVVLARLAGYHQGLAGAAGFREVFVSAGAQHFPAPADVAPLTAGLLAATGRLFSEAKDVRDELRVATFALWGLIAVHPFTDGNGRTAVDFVQALCMLRWNLAAPPFKEEPRLDQTLAPVFQAAEIRSDGSPAAVLAQLQGMTQLFSTVTLARLAADPHFDTMAKVAASFL